MKNKTFVICICAILGLFLLCMMVSCMMGGGKPDAKKITENMSAPFDAKANITFNGMELTADVNQTAVGEMTVGVTKPDILKGLAFSYDGKDMRLSYNNMSVTLDGESPAASSAAKILIDSINAAAKGSGTTITSYDGVTSVAGKGESGSFEIKVDKKGGSIISVSVPEADFECRFEDFLFKEE